MKKGKKLESLKDNLFNSQLMTVSGGAWDSPRKTKPMALATRNLDFTGVSLDIYTDPGGTAGDGQ